MLTLPRWVPAAARLNRQNDAAATQLTGNADGEPIPVAYGPCQLGGRIWTRVYDATTGMWTVGAIFCLGEINRFVRIYLDNEIPGSNVEINTYVGSTSQGVDPLLEAAIGSSFTDTFVIDHPDGDIGIAHCVIRYPEELYPSPPAILAEIEGKLVEDPDNPSGPLYSEYAALFLRDLITSPHYGLDELVDDDSVAVVRDFNAETVITEARRLTGIVLDVVQETTAWIEILRAYAGCWTYKRGDTWVLVPDRDNASDPVRALTQADILENTLDEAIADAADVPTVVRVQYTDPTTEIWRTREAIAELAGVSNGTVPRRESFVRMPGVFRYSQAMREAQERLNKLQRLRSISFVTFDDNLDLEVGDVFSLTHPYGFSGEYFRIVEPPRILRAGRVGVRAVEYSGTDYVDTEEAESFATVDYRVGDPANLPEPGATQGAPTGTVIGGALLAEDVESTIDGPHVLNEAIATAEGATYRSLSKGFAVGAAGDGDSVTFDPTWTATPEVRFGAGGLTYNASLSGDQHVDFTALSVSGSGFTARLKTKELVGAPTLRTDSTVSTPSSPSGLDKSINKGQTDEAYDDKYTFQIDVSITNQSLGAGEYNPGQVVVGFYTNDGSGWVQRATQTYFGSGAAATTSRLNQTKQITVDGLGLNDDFGVTVESSLYGGSISSFDNVTYYTATSPAEESATPSGATDVEYFVLGT